MVNTSLYPNNAFLHLLPWSVCDVKKGGKVIYVPQRASQIIFSSGKPSQSLNEFGNLTSLTYFIFAINNPKQNVNKKRRLKPDSRLQSDLNYFITGVSSWVFWLFPIYLLLLQPWGAKAESSTANVGKILWEESWSSPYWSATDAAVTWGASANGGTIKKLRGLSASLQGLMAAKNQRRRRLIAFVYFVFYAAHKHRRDPLKIPCERWGFGEQTFHRGEEHNVKRVASDSLF